MALIFVLSVMGLIIVWEAPSATSGIASSQLQLMFSSFACAISVDSVISPSASNTQLIRRDVASLIFNHTESSL